MCFSIPDFSDYRLPVVTDDFKVFFKIPKPEDFHKTNRMICNRPALFIKIHYQEDGCIFSQE